MGLPAWIHPVNDTAPATRSCSYKKRGVEKSVDTVKTLDGDVSNIEYVHENWFTQAGDAIANTAAKRDPTTPRSLHICGRNLRVPVLF